MMWLTRRCGKGLRLRTPDGKNRIYHQSPIQTAKSQPKGNRIMPETRFTSFPATSFPALSIDSKVGISRSASGCRYLIIFLTYDIKNYYLSFVISFIFDIL